MSVDTTYKCVCGIQKQETNHWFLLFYLPSGAIRLEKWNPLKINFTGAVHLCGQACLAKVISQWTATTIPTMEGMNDNGHEEEQPGMGLSSPQGE
jgi:hypothetical protein